MGEKPRSHGPAERHGVGYCIPIWFIDKTLEPASAIALPSPIMSQPRWRSLQTLWGWIGSVHTLCWLLGLLGGGSMIALIVDGLLRRIHISTSPMTEALLFAGSFAVFAFGMLGLRKHILNLHQEIAYLKTGLVIHSARYGAGDSTTDVAPYLRQQIAKGRRKIPVGDNLLDGGKDPAKCAEKDLLVEFARSGEKRIKKIQQQRPPLELDLT